MKNVNYLKNSFYLLCLGCSFIFSCERIENAPEIIGVSTELTAYEKYVDDINSGRIDSSLFIYTDDGVFLYYNNFYNSVNMKYEKISVTKFNANEELVWSFTYDNQNNTSIALGDLIVTNDGSVVFAATYWFPPDLAVWDFNTNESDIVLVKISSDGKLLWEKQIELPDLETVSTVSQTTDEGFIITGLVFYKVDGGGIQLPNECFLLKSNSYGDIAWHKKYLNQSFAPIPNNIIQTPDEGYIATFIQELYFPEKDLYSFIIKFNQNGDIVNFNNSINLRK